MELDISMQNNLISVIIPMFNREKTIEECLKSICNQTYKNIEILVVDDCSFDNSVQLVKNYLDYRIRLIQLKNNSGAQVARNKGIIEAKGEWIAFNDSDDIWDRTKLEKQIKVLENNNFDKRIIVHSNCYCLDQKKNKSWVWFLPATEGNCFKQLLQRPAPMFQGLLVSKMLLMRVGLLDDNVPSYQEWDSAIKISRYGNFIHIKEPLFTYIFHSGETISKNKRRDLDGFLYVLNKYESEMKKYGFYEDHIVFLTLRAIEFKLFDYAKNIINLDYRRKIKFFLLKILVNYKISNKYVLKIVRRLTR